MVSIPNVDVEHAGATKRFTPADDIEIRRKIIRWVIKTFFYTQALCGKACECDQSAVSGWIARGEVPANRQRQMMADVRRRHEAGEIDRLLEANDFVTSHDD